MGSTESQLVDAARPDGWSGRPAAQQPQWRDHPAFVRTQQTLTANEPLVLPAELGALRRALVLVAAGEARVLQLGDCAESFYECTPWHTTAKLEMLAGLARRFEERTGAPVVRIGRIGGQFAKPRSQPTERHGSVDIPAFRGHLINSEVATSAARQADPRRMLWAYEASAKVLALVRIHREMREQQGTEAGASGPWSSHEALVVDYEQGLVRTDAATGAAYLASTHLPWIGERTRQLGSAHVHLLSSVSNPVGCKIGPSARIADVLELCAALDPDRVPGRLVLISRMGRDKVADVLPEIAAAVRQAGHPVIWLCDPMHGNTVRAPSGIKTRYVRDMVAEATIFWAVLNRLRLHPGGLHLEVAADEVRECIGGQVVSLDELGQRYTTLCDPRLNPEQAFTLLDAVGG